MAEFQDLFQITTQGLDNVLSLQSPAYPEPDLSDCYASVSEACKEAVVDREYLVCDPASG